MVVIVIYVYLLSVVLFAVYVLYITVCVLHYGSMALPSTESLNNQSID